jgi:predicted P-loop ATPase
VCEALNDRGERAVRIGSLAARDGAEAIRFAGKVPRSCVFAGTVNPDAYLRDETGARRFWPIRCGSIDTAALARDRDQLWAEAVARFRAGAIWWLDTRELTDAAALEQDKRYQADAWDAQIARWITHEVRTVAGTSPNDAPRTESVERATPLADVSVGEILGQCIGLEPGRWTRADQMRAGAYLKAKGWERYQTRKAKGRHGAKEWRYRNPAPAGED